MYCWKRADCETVARELTERGAYEWHMYMYLFLAILAFVAVFRMHPSQQQLRLVRSTGVPCLPFHADLHNSVKQQVQQQFAMGQIKVRTDDPCLFV